MAAIDSRATITCNLGEVISGGVSDSYLQNSGLVFTRGQLSLAGISTPDIGSDVTINYQLNDGGSGSIPRSLVVLSAFADPFRGTTEVSVGCKLTYLDGVMPVPSLENGEAAYVGPRQLECLNGLPPSAFVPPIQASQLFSYCINKLGLTSGFANGNLTGTYMMEKYDLTQGYVSAIGNLLLSEGYVGFMASNTRFNAVDISRQPGAGSKSLSTDDIIELSGINSGEQPASIVIVPYIDKKLEAYEPEEARWEEVESVGDPEQITLQSTNGAVTVRHTPTTKTITEYGEPVDLTNQCELYDGGFGDLSNTVVKTTTTRSTVLGFAAGGYVTQMLDEGKQVNPSLEGEVEQITTHEFDEKDRPSKTITETYEPFFVYAGRMSLQWVFEGSHVNMGNDKLLVERTVEEYEYAGEATVPEGLKPGQDVAEPVVYQRVHRYTYQAWGKTQGGSQGPAESTTLEAFSNAQEVIDYVYASTGLVMTDSEVQSNKAFNPKGQVRPGEADRAVEQGTLDQKGRETKYVELQMEFGAGRGGTARVVQYSPPHLSESYFSSSGGAVNVDTYAKSAKFGRAQHRLAVGNRLGMSITATPDKLALDPYDGLSITAAGYTATYAVNALNFSFGRDGIVASVDALFIGGNGLNVTKKQVRELPPCWFYLPPDYDETTLPPAGDGQLIPPFNERVNVQAGIKLGTRVTGQLVQNLIPQTVEIGVALGVDGSMGTFKQLVEVGVAVGAEGDGTLAFTEAKSIGVALGTNVIPSFAEVPMSMGVKVGVNIGPPSDQAALLMHFDDFDPEEGYSETDWVDSSVNNITLTNTEVGTFNAFIIESNETFGLSRFGPARGSFYSADALVDYEERAGVLSERTSALTLGPEWTIEFWLMLPALGWPETKPTQPWCMLSMDNSERNGIQFYLLWSEVSGNFIPTMNVRHKGAEGTDYDWSDQYEGSQVIQDTWTHIAVAKTQSGLRFYQDGVTQGGLNWPGLQTEPVDRICLGGLARAEWSDKVRDWPFSGEIDELRILNNHAAYDIDSPTIEVPTGPFAP